MPTIERNQVSTYIDNICRKPSFIFSVTCKRRTNLDLRYPPVDLLHNGPLAYVGDASRIVDRKQVRYCDCVTDEWVEIAVNSRKCKNCGKKRMKVVLEEAGTLRKMIVRGKSNIKDMKHWESKGGSLAFDPAEHGLKLVAGMYNDAPKHGRIGRHGQWRCWAMICLRTIQTIRHLGETYSVCGQLDHN